MNRQHCATTSSFFTKAKRIKASLLSQPVCEMQTVTHKHGIPHQKLQNPEPHHPDWIPVTMGTGQVAPSMCSGGDLMGEWMVT